MWWTRIRCFILSGQLKSSPDFVSLTRPDCTFSFIWLGGRLNDKRIKAVWPKTLYGEISIWFYEVFDSNFEIFVVFHNNWKFRPIDQYRTFKHYSLLLVKSVHYKTGPVQAKVPLELIMQLMILIAFGWPYLEDVRACLATDCTSTISWWVHCNCYGSELVKH